MGSFVHFLNATMSESPWIETKPDKEPSRRLIYWLGPQWLWRGWNAAGLEPNYTLLWPIFSPFNSHSLLTSTSNPTSLWRSQETFRNVLAQQAISFLWPTGRACHQIASVVCSCLSCSNSLPDISNSVFEPLSGFMVFFVLLLWNVMIPLLLEHWVWGSPSLCSWVTLIPIWVQKKKKKDFFSPWRWELCFCLNTAWGCYTFTKHYWQDWSAGKGTCYYWPEFNPHDPCLQEKNWPQRLSSDLHLCAHAHAHTIHKSM